MSNTLEHAVGEAAYQTYNDTQGIDGKNFRGDPSPAFDKLPEQIQRGWARVALAAAGLTAGTYGWALAQLQFGQKVARAKWGGYWRMEEGRFPASDTGTMDMVVAHLGEGGEAPAQPYWADMLAVDWIIVE